MDVPLGHRRGEAGFSLLELMAVVAILSVLTVGAMLALGRPAPGPGRDAATLETLFREMRQIAVQGQRPVGLDLTQQGWRRADPVPGGWTRAGREVAWAGPVGIVALPPAPRPGSAEPPTVIFLRDGRVTPVTLQLGPSGTGVACATDGFAPFRCREPG